MHTDGPNTGPFLFQNLLKPCLPTLRYVDLWRWLNDIVSTDVIYPPVRFEIWQAFPQE
jgi:hypothetical protein